MNLKAARGAGGRCIVLLLVYAVVGAGHASAQCPGGQCQGAGCVQGPCSEAGAADTAADRLTRAIASVRPTIERSLAQFEIEGPRIGRKAASLVKQLGSSRVIEWDDERHIGPAENSLDANDGVSKDSWKNYIGDSLTALNPATFQGCLEPLEIESGPYYEQCAENCPALVEPGPGCLPGAVPNPFKVITYWLPAYQITSGLKAGAPSLDVQQFFPTDNAPELLRSATSELHDTVNKAAVRATIAGLGLDADKITWPEWHHGEPFNQQQLELFDVGEAGQSFQLGFQTNLHVQTTRDRPRKPEAWKGYSVEPRCVFGAFDRPEKKVVTNATYHGWGLYWLLANVPELTQLVSPQMYYATVQLPYNIESGKVDSFPQPLAPSFRSLRWAETFGELTDVGITPGVLEPWHRRSVFYGGDIAPFNVTRLNTFTDPTRADIFRAATAAFLFGSKNRVLSAVNLPLKRHLQFTYLKTTPSPSGGASQALNNRGQVFVDKLQVVFPEWIAPAAGGPVLGALPGFDAMSLADIPGAADALIGSIPTLGDLPLGSIPGLSGLSLGDIPGLSGLDLGSIAGALPVNLGQLFNPGDLLGQIPGFGSLPIPSIPGLSGLNVGAIPGLSGLTLGQLPGIGNLGLGSIPGLGNTAIGSLPSLSGLTLGALPDLASLPIGSLPSLGDIRLGDFVQLPNLGRSRRITAADFAGLAELNIGAVDGLAEALIAGNIQGIGSLPTLSLPALEQLPLSSIQGLLDLPIAQVPPLLDLPLSGIPDLLSQPLGSLPSILSLPLGSIPGISSLSPAQLGIDLPLANFPDLLNLSLGSLPGFGSLSLGDLGSALNLNVGDLPGLGNLSLGDLPGLLDSSLLDFPSLADLPLSQFPNLLGSALGSIQGALDAVLGDFAGLLDQPLSAVPGLLGTGLPQIPGLAELPLGSIPGLGEPMFPGAPGAPVPNMRLGSQCFRPEDVHNGEDPLQTRAQGRFYVPKDLRKRYVNKKDLAISGETRVIVWTKRVVCACSVCGIERGCLTLNDGDNFEDTIEGHPTVLPSPFKEALPLMYKAAALPVPKPPWVDGELPLDQLPDIGDLPGVGADLAGGIVGDIAGDIAGAAGGIAEGIAGDIAGGIAGGAAGAIGDALGTAGAGIFGGVAEGVADAVSGAAAEALDGSPASAAGSIVNGIPGAGLFREGTGKQLPSRANIPARGSLGQPSVEDDSKTRKRPSIFGGGAVNESHRF